MISITLAILLGLYFVSNGFLLGGYVSTDYKNNKFETNFINILTVSAIGILVVLTAYVIVPLWKLFYIYVYVDVRFYWRVYFTKYYETITKLNLDENDVKPETYWMYKFHSLSQTNPSKYFKQRIERHLISLDKLLNYDYKKDLEERKQLEKERENNLNSSCSGVTVYD